MKLIQWTQSFKPNSTQSSFNLFLDCPSPTIVRKTRTETSYLIEDKASKRKCTPFISRRLPAYKRWISFFSALSLAQIGIKHKVSSEVTKTFAADLKVIAINGSYFTNLFNTSRITSLIFSLLENERVRAGGMYSPPATGPKIKGIPSKPKKEGCLTDTKVTCWIKSNSSLLILFFAQKYTPICQIK